jgi:hypothetical protein
VAPLSIVRQPIPSLYGGVSQQAAALRSLNQVQSATNCTFTVREGISKRNPTMLVSRLAERDPLGEDPGVPFAGWFFHDVRHPNGEVYILALPGDGSYRVFRERDGAIMPLNDDTGQAYLTVAEGSTAADVFRAIAVGDKVYIVNTSVVVAMKTDVAPGTISGTAQTLQDEALGSAPEGSIYRIVGSSGNDYDTHYAKKTQGRWFEWVEPGVTTEIEPTSMPHAVTIQEAEANPLGVVCSFGPLVWGQRLVGDAKSNKEPSFVGRRISGVAFQFDRLGLLAANHVSFSETGEYLNFWRTTVTDVLDTDRIDVTVTGAGNSTLYWAKPLARSVMLFAGSRQFSMDGNPIFSPRTVTVSEATTYSSSPRCEPVNLGANVYFASDSVSSSQIMEMFTQEDVVAKEAANITSHVPSYIPSAVEQMVANPNFDTVIVRTLGSPDLYIYEFMWSGDQKVQSAWGKWTISGATRVLHLYTRDEYVYALVEYQTFDDFTNDSVEILSLVRLNLNRRSGVWRQFTTNGEPVCMDNLHVVDPVYNAAQNRTYYRVGLPMAGQTDTGVLFIGGTLGGRFQRLALNAPQPIFWEEADLFYMVGNVTSRAAVGYNYTMRWTLSEQFFFDGERPNLVARVQIRNMTIRFSETANFGVQVKMRGAPISNQNITADLLSTYSGRTTGNEDLTLGLATRVDGQFTFPVLGRSSDIEITFTNSEPTPSNFNNAEWEALVSSRSRR